MPNVQPDMHKLSAIKENFEGFSVEAYRDSGSIWTIGFGSTFNHNQNRKVQLGDTITRQTAIAWMTLDTQNVINQANQYITTPLNPDQSAAIVDYIYNRGIGNFLKTNLDELINKNPTDPAIKQAFYTTGIKDRLGNLLWGLGRRRRAEYLLYSTGQLQFNFARWSS